jgi:hypothetical protein
MTWLKDFLAELLKLLAWWQLGQEQQRRKLAEANVDVLKDHAKIDARPALARNELYDRLRARAGMPDLPGPASGSDRGDVAGKQPGP